MKKILIIGSCGLVGMNLMSMIDTTKYEVVSIDKNQHNIALARKIFPGIRFVVADVTRPGAWEKEFVLAHTVIQLQAQISSPHKELYVRNNMQAVERVVGLCLKHKIKHLIHFSSSVVISVAHDDYTLTKREGENIVVSSGVPYTVLRPPLMYGCFDIKHLGFLTRILEMSPLFPMPGSGRYMRQPLFVNDVCSVVLKLIEGKPKNKVFNIIGKEKIYLISLLRIIARKKKLHRYFVTIPIPLFLMCLKSYGFLTGRKPFVPDQLKALMAGDSFPVSDWDEEFKVRYTPFEEGVNLMMKSPYYRYRFKMKPSS